MDAELPSGLVELREGIQAWRLGCAKSKAMPSALWAGAIKWAKRMGISPASHALGLNPTRLRERMHRESVEAVSSSGGFMELRGTEVVVPERSQPLPPSDSMAGSVIEVCSDHGNRLTIRLGVGQLLDLTALVRAFRD